MHLRSARHVCRQHLNSLLDQELGGRLRVGGQSHVCRCAGRWPGRETYRSARDVKRCTRRSAYAEDTERRKDGPLNVRLRPAGWRDGGDGDELFSRGPLGSRLRSHGGLCWQAAGPRQRSARRSEVDAISCTSPSCDACI
ncbi:hypothetical protein BD310DRAFT_928783 [Dichomitus squalens]|uniref:Uncharacterized protein n=1 Tax=Dichomitus squalens TaxID=114155 RepID=A0A4Q9PT69_9APHY|nr:hypothetical protein BD310DRAFT_928783 [Dichomitus squalens]